MNESGKKFDWVLWLSLMVIVGGIVFLVFMGSKFGIFDGFFKKSQKIEDQNKISIEDKYCDYAKKTLDWMDKKRDNDGKYYFNIDGSNKSGYIESLILWARYKYFLKTKDQEQLLIVKKDIDIYLKESELKPIKNYLWNCRVFLEMRDEKILGTDYVEKIDKICKAGKYVDTENVVTDKDGKKNILSLSNFDWENLTDKDLSSLNQDTVINGAYSLYVTYPSDFVARYKIWNDENDLDVANAYFNKLMVEYKINYTKFSPKDRCLMAVSSLDLFSINKDDEYLKMAMYVYYNYFGENEILSKAKIPECAFLARELSKYDNSRDYKSNQNKLLDFFIENNWSGNDDKNKVSGEGGFFKFMKDGYLFKPLKENALIINLLCQ